LKQLYLHVAINNRQSVYPHDITKLMQPSTNLSQKCSTMSPGNSFIWGRKGQRSRYRCTKENCLRGLLQSCECRLLVCSVPSVSPIDLYDDDDDADCSYPAIIFRVSTNDITFRNIADI